MAKILKTATTTRVEGEKTYTEFAETRETADIYREASGQSWLNLRKLDAALINHFNHGTEWRKETASPILLPSNPFSQTGKKLTYGKKNLDRIFILRNSILEKISRVSKGTKLLFRGDKVSETSRFLYLLARRCCFSFHREFRL